VRANVSVLLAATALVAGCSSGGHSSIVTPDGRIGSLHVDRSDAYAVIASAGRPDVDWHASEVGSRRFRALGYGCSSARYDTGWPLGAPRRYCQTVFFLRARTGRLGDFYTTSTRYSEAHGVRIGMATAAAERRVHQLVYVGCEQDIHLGMLTIAFAGGAPLRLPRSDGLHLVGGRVYAFAMHSARNDVGVFDCL
jgi:hypothetical protein